MICVSDNIITESTALKFTLQQYTLGTDILGTTRARARVCVAVSCVRVRACGPVSPVTRHCTVTVTISAGLIAQSQTHDMYGIHDGILAMMIRPRKPRAEGS